MGQYKPRLDPLQLDYGSIRKVSAIGGGGVATKGAQAWEPRSGLGFWGLGFRVYRNYSGFGGEKSFCFASKHKIAQREPKRA